MKRIIDIILSFIGIIIFSPILIVIISIILLTEKSSPFYIANRVGKCGKLFKMIKLRSMFIDSDKVGIDSTSENDSRITKVGHFIRRYKLDEITQLINVLIGNMSLVGPRPNVERETKLYTSEEKNLLSVKPGITDYASIVFSDEAKILRGKADPDIAYHQLIRPGKSQLGLFYIYNNNLIIDIKLILITAISLFSRKLALKLVCKQLSEEKASYKLINLASRKDQLNPMPPPGSNHIVTTREL